MQTLEHRYAQVNGVRLHYVIAGAGEPVLLLHGFPQTWYEWRGLIDALAVRYQVLAPDYRGAGDSERPQGGYDKHQMMEDLRGLVHQLGLGPVRVVGHDIGAMIAYRYAAAYPDEVRQLVLMDAPIPGTPAMAQIRAMPRAWHVHFHQVRDIAEMLVAGKEREYLRYFFESRYARPGVIAPEALERYIAAYSAPGALRAGFELYRAWDQDSLDNAPYLANKLALPALVLGGERSTSGPLLESMARALFTDLRFRLITNAGHWLCEENPEQVQDLLLEFFASA